jgi:hypothetical protein
MSAVTSASQLDQESEPVEPVRGFEVVAEPVDVVDSGLITSTVVLVPSAVEPIGFTTGELFADVDAHDAAKTENEAKVMSTRPRRRVFDIESLSQENLPRCWSVKQRSGCRHPMLRTPLERHRAAQREVR